MKDNNENNTSQMLSLLYARKAKEIIDSNSKKYYIIIIVIGIMIIFSILDILEETHNPIISDYMNDLIIAILAVVSILLLSILLSIILRWKKKMLSWSNLFENNSIVAEIIMLMNKRSKEEALIAIANILEGIDNPLLSYLNSNQNNKKNFLDVKINDHITFDVLIDPSRIISLPQKKLEQTLTEKGSIIIKVIDEQIVENDILSFEKQIREYHLLCKRKIRLAFIIGKSINPNTEKIPQKIVTKNKYIEKFRLC